MGSKWLDEVGLENGDELFAVLDRHPQVRVLLWGHVHQAYEGLRKRVRMLSTPSTCAQFTPGSDGFAVDRRPPAYRWIDLHADGRIETGVEWVDEAEVRHVPPAPRVVSRG
jgi:Icc protein